MSEKTTVFNYESGYSIVKFEDVDENGNVIGEYWVLYDPQGKPVGRYTSLDEAERYLEEISNNHLPSPGSLVRK